MHRRKPIRMALQESRAVSPMPLGVAVACLLILILGACTGDDSSETTQVQDTTEETAVNTEDLSSELMAEFTSSTGKFRLEHPSPWVVEETFKDASLVLANQRGALDRYQAGDKVESGDLVINVGFLPFDLMRQRELVPLGIQFDASPDSLLESVLPMFHIQGAESIGAVALLSLGEDRAAGVAEISGEGQEGRVMLVTAGEQVVALVSTLTAPGEQDTYDEVVGEIVSSVEYEGESGELYNGLLTG